MPQHYRDSLAAFHQAFGVQPLSHLTGEHDRLAMVALRATLIAEETREFTEAMEEHRAQPTTATLAHASKELADVLYVTVGTSHILSTPAADPHPVLHLPLLLNEDTLCARSRVVVLELDDLARMVSDGDPLDDQTALIDALGSDLQLLINTIGEVAHGLHIPLRQVFDEVHTSNMSKVNPTTGKPDYRQDGKVLKGPGYREPDLSFLAEVA